jgi:orotidine-5'-phosphate decarboxylase
MNKLQLLELIKRKRSFLCVGLDTDINKIPQILLDFEDPVFEFNRQIIDVTLPFAVAYKPNLAFYEVLGSKGMASLEKTMDYINNLPEKVFTIADAKRGDIGNSASYYAKAFFEGMGFDAVTVSPYMGYDSLQPFLAYKGKWTISLALTSNKGSEDFQLMTIDEETEGFKQKAKSYFFETVMSKAQKWTDNDQLMFVVGATQGNLFRKVRKVAPDTFLLVPGIGAQGGSLEQVATYGMTNECGLLVNASRSIIFASPDKDFALNAKKEANSIQKEMEQLLMKKGII